MACHYPLVTPQLHAASDRNQTRSVPVDFHSRPFPGKDEVSVPASPYADQRPHTGTARPPLYRLLTCQQAICRNALQASAFLPTTTPFISSKELGNLPPHEPCIKSHRKPEQLIFTSVVWLAGSSERRVADSEVLQEAYREKLRGACTLHIICTCLLG